MKNIELARLQDNVMLKLSKNDNTITIYLVGIKNYDSIGVNII